MNNSFQRSARTLGLSFSVLMGLALAGCTPGGAGSSASGTASAGSETLATVGTTKVTRTELADLLIAQNGEQALPYLIDTQLIFESLKSKGLDVTDAEVEADLTRRQESDPAVAQIIKAGGSKLDSAKRQIRRDLAMQKLLTADVKTTEAQVKSFYDKYHTYYDAPAKIKVGLLFASTKVRADLMTRQLAQKTKTFEALVAEQKKANDPIASQSVAERASFEPLESFPPNIRTPLEKLPKGGSTSAQQLSVGTPQPVFVIFRKVDFQPVKKADFKVLMPQLENDYKMAQIAQKTVKENPKNPPFEVTLTKTRDYVQSQNPGGTAPSLRDVLGFINQNTANALLTSLRGSGTVQVDDPTFATVAQQYQAATPTPAATGAGTAGATAVAPSSTESPAPANDKDTAPNGADKAAPDAVKR